MALSRRTKMFMVAAGLAGAGTVAGAGAALADAGPGPGPVHTRLQIVDHKVPQAGAPGRDCPDKSPAPDAGRAEGTQ